MKNNPQEPAPHVVYSYITEGTQYLNEWFKDFRDETKERISTLENKIFRLQIYVLVLFMICLISLCAAFGIAPSALADFIKSLIR